MASNYPFSLDLNLAPPTQTRGQAAAPVWVPYFASGRGPVTVTDSILLDNDVAIGVGRNLVTPKDIRVFGTRDDNRVASDAMALSVQSAACVASLGHRLLAKSHEVEVLKGQLAAERSMVEDCQTAIKSLKRERARIVEVNRHQLEVLRDENKNLSKMVELYSRDMRKQLEDLDRPGKRKRADRERSYAQAKIAIFESSSELEDLDRPGKRKRADRERSYAQAKIAIFESSSGEPQEAVHEAQEEDSQRAKLKALMVETPSTVKK
ncbi:hypothetical protein ACE6H2_015577 [Prunus campanulata]